MSIAEWREMPKWEDELPSDEADALRDRLRDVAKVLEDSQRLHTGFCQTGWKEDKRACSACDAQEAIPAILKRLKEEGLM